MPDHYSEIDECDYITCPHCNCKQLLIQNNSECVKRDCGKNMYLPASHYPKAKQKMEVSKIELSEKQIDILERLLITPSNLLSRRKDDVQELLNDGLIMSQKEPYFEIMYFITSKGKLFLTTKTNNNGSLAKTM